jgi:hypothetical protein
VTSEGRGEPSARRGGRLGGILAVLALMAAAAGAALASGDLAVVKPALEIEAPPELAPAAARLAALEADLGAFAVLIGLTEAGPPIRVLLATEESELARRVPSWVAGFARSDDDLVVLFPDRVPTYPYSSFPELVRHELAHVLIGRASGNAKLPRWFNEGLAMVAEGGWQMADRSRLALTVVASGEPSTEQLDALFGADESWVGRAYATSGAFVRRLVRLHGREFPARLLAETRRGASFDEAFLATTGTTSTNAFHAFWRRATVWYRWVPFVTSSTVLWIGVTMLALIAIRRRRQRDRAQHLAWELEEAQRELAALRSSSSDDLVN